MILQSIDCLIQKSAEIFVPFNAHALRVLGINGDFSLVLLPSKDACVRTGHEHTAAGKVRGDPFHELLLALLELILGGLELRADLLV